MTIGLWQNESITAAGVVLGCASLRGQACTAAAPWTGVHSALQRYNRGRGASLGLRLCIAFTSLTNAKTILSIAAKNPVS
jgi:hypothetical protein